MNFAVIISIFAFATVNSWSTNDSYISNRIVNGRTAKHGEFPFAVLITYYWYYVPGGQYTFCGGTIIHESWVLTSGHCVLSKRGPNSKNTRIIVQAGTIYRRGDERRAEVRTSQSIYVWPEYNRLAVFNEKDIALIKVWQPFHLDGFYKRAAKLPELNAQYDGKVRVAGWGHTTLNYTTELLYDSVPNELQVGEYHSMTYEECQKALRTVSKIYNVGVAPLPPTNICTGPLNLGQGICEGDSGSGLISDDSNDEPVVVGVVMRHYVGCGGYGSPSIYVDVAHFVRWINSVTGIPFYWSNRLCKNGRCDHVH